MSPSATRDDFYKILGIAKTATQDQIRDSYRALAKKLHPDLNPGNKQAEARFKKVSEAYDTLSDPKKREAYDRGEEALGSESFGGQAGGRGPFYYETQSGPRGGRYSRGFSFEDLFSGGENSPFGNLHMGDVEDEVSYRLTVDFKEAILGGEREVTLPRGRRIHLKIPAGIESGTKLRIPGQGGAVIEVGVRPSRVFKREGRDLMLELPITLGEAVLGAEIHVPTIEGKVALKIPAGVNTGARLRIRGRGVPGRSREPRGDEIVVLKIMLPKTIDPELRSVIENWSRHHYYNPRTHLREDDSHAA